MHFVWPNCIDSWSKRVGKFDKDVVRQFIACPFGPTTFTCALSLSLPLSLHVCFLSICFGVCAASCLNAATLFNGKKFTLPLASRKLRPRMGEAYVVAVPLAPLVALAHFYSHTLGYCCCFCWTFVQIEAMFLLPVPCAKQKPNKQLTTRRATNGWRKEAQLK